MRQVASLPHVLSIRPISLTCSRRMTSHNVRSSRAPASNHRHIPSVPCRVTAAAGPRPEGISHRHDDTPAALADSWKAINFFLATLAACPPALADTGVTYNPQDGSETLKTVAGVGYIILVIIYFFRLFKKRADKATSERIASSGSDADAEEDSDDEEEAEQPVDDVTPLQCFM